MTEFSTIGPKNNVTSPNSVNTKAWAIAKVIASTSAASTMLLFDEFYFVTGSKVEFYFASPLTTACNNASLSQGQQRGQESNISSTWTFGERFSSLPKNCSLSATVVFCMYFGGLFCSIYSLTIVCSCFAVNNKRLVIKRRKR